METKTMARHAVLLLCLSAVLAPRSDDRREQSPRQEQIVRAPHLGKLTLEQAWRLDGVRTTFCVQVKDNGYRVGAYDEYSCESQDAEVERSVRFRAGPEKEGVQLVEGVLRVLEHGPSVIGQVAFPGFVELRLYVRADGAGE
jgi:hypothetical protein